MFTTPSPILWFCFALRVYIWECNTCPSPTAHNKIILLYLMVMGAKEDLPTSTLGKCVKIVKFTFEKYEYVMTSYYTHFSKSFMAGWGWKPPPPNRDKVNYDLPLSHIKVASNTIHLYSITSVGIFKLSVLKSFFN